MDYKFKIEAIDENAFDRAYSKFQQENPPGSSPFTVTPELFAQVAFEQGIKSLDPGLPPA